MPPHDLSDTELITRCADQGDAAAWELFVRTYSRLIWSTIHKTFRASSFRYSAEDAEDVYSSIFLSLLQNDCRKLRQFQGRNGCKLSTWLTVVCVRATIDLMRRQVRLDQHARDEDEGYLDSVPDPSDSIEKALVDAEERSAIDHAIRSLPAGDRELFELLQVEDLAPSEAAARLGISVAAFYTRKHRLVARLQKVKSDV